VKRVRAYWAFNAVEQRAMLILYVGDDAAAKTAATAAISGIGERDDAEIRVAHPVTIRVRLRLVIDSRYDTETVTAAVRTALIDDDKGLFGVKRGRIGRAIYRSALHKACRDVEGVIASEALAVSLVPATSTSTSSASRSSELAFVLTFLSIPLQTHRYDPGEGGFFTIENPDTDLTIQTEVASG
jgi:hypothetical protein